jgi:hypothetical protein
MAVLAGCHDDHGFLPWLLTQPDMDRATAGWLFLWPEGSMYLVGNTSNWSLLDNSTEPEMLSLFSAICERSEQSGFARDECGLDAGFEAERLKCLEIFAQGKVLSGITFPHRLISTPFKPPMRSGYRHEDAGLIFCE